jgi:hypothetical protein
MSNRSRNGVPFRCLLPGLWVLGLVTAYPAVAASQARWTLAQELRIGSAEQQFYDFTYVPAIAVGRGGEIFVAQPQDRAIRVYDARGAYQRAFGRRGAGPGEFQRVDGLGWKGDSLWVSDLSLQRITFFDRTGRVLDTVRAVTPVLPGSGYPAGPAAVLSDGSLVASPSPATASIQRQTVGRMPLVRMTRSGTIQGGFGELDARGQAESIRRARLSVTFTLPIQSHSLWAAAPDGSGVVVVHRQPAEERGHGSFRVVRYTPSGRVVFDRAYNYVPKPVEGPVADSIHDYLASMFVERGFVPARRQAESFARDSVQLPRYQPPVDGVVVGRDGTIWLRREHWGTSREEYLVLDSTGAIAATVTAPAGLRILAAERDRVWGVMVDEMELPYVFRFQIRRTGA